MMGVFIFCRRWLDGLKLVEKVFFIEDKVVNEIFSIPSAMVLFNPVLDTTESGYGAKKVGNRPEELSPLHHIREDIPPTIIFHGTDDMTVPFNNARMFEQKMKEKGNQCILVSYEGKGHGFFNPGPDQDKFS